MLTIDLSIIWAIIGGFFLMVGGLILAIHLTSFRDDQSITWHVITIICIIAGIGFINSGFPFIKVVP